MVNGTNTQEARLDRRAPAGATRPVRTADVAIVVPLSDRPELQPHEHISLRHIQHYLGRYDRYALAPEGMPAVRWPGFETRHLPRRYFGSPLANSSLLLSPWFYESFSAYTHILIHHLDALVLRDELLEWCAEPIDYIGPPWLSYEHCWWLIPWKQAPAVGNGGFSLRRLEPFAKVFASRRPTHDPAVYWERFADRPFISRMINRPRRWAKHIPAFNNIRWDIARSKYHEDQFWSFMAEHYEPTFRKATLEQALRFAFETEPRRALEMTGGHMPFGCHAWPKHDRAFWEPFLLV